jgi:Protein of unknown function (DUF1629)
MPRDLNLYGAYWLVSERLKDVLEAVDPAAFEFVDCDFTLPDGSKGPHYYLADVVRVLDALDEEASQFKTRYDRDHRTNQTIKYYSFTGRTSLAFREQIVGDVHIFRTPYSSTEFCDGVLKAACKMAGITGVRFIDADKT